MINIISKATGLTKERFYTGTVTDFTHVTLGKCFRISFPSGASVWYSYRIFTYTIDDN